MIVISRVHDSREKADYWFALDPGSPEQPFLFGANSADPALPSVAVWSAGSSFNLDTINTLSGSLWQDWRAALGRCGAPWVVPILETALASGEPAPAITAILEGAGIAAKDPCSDDLVKNLGDRKKPVDMQE